MAHVDVSGARLWVEESGAGEPLVLLHSGIADRRVWEPCAALLAERFRVVAYDQRGYGRSTPIEGPYSNVADLRALLDALELERVALAGLSRGGRIALDFAFVHPGRVSALALLCSPVGGRPLELDVSPELEARWDAAEARGDLADMAEIDLLFWAPLGADEAMRAMVHENAAASNGPDPDEELDPPALARLSELAAPTLVVTAADDAPTFEDAADELVAGIAGARRERIARADHMLPLRRPDELARLLAGFLAGDGRE